MFNAHLDQPPIFLGGIALYVQPDVPRMQLSPDCPVTPEFRADMNAWMRDFFGTTNLLKDGHIYIDTNSRRHYCNPRTLEFLKRAERVEAAAQSLRESIADHLATAAKSVAKDVPKPPKELKQRFNKHRKQIPRR